MVAKLKVKSFVATICIMFMLRGLLQYLCQGFSPKASAEILKMDIIGTKLAVAFLILMAAYIVYTYTPFGRYVRMIGSGEIAVKYSGVNVNAIKIVSFVIAGTLAGVAGIFSLLRTGGVIATSGNLLETDVMISLVLGGLPITGGMKSRFSAVVIGALLLTVLANGLVQIGASVVLQQMIKGIVFLAVISVTMDRNADLVK